MQCQCPSYTLPGHEATCKTKSQSAVGKRVAKHNRATAVTEEAARRSGATAVPYFLSLAYKLRRKRENYLV